jgi:hypothetical protein
MNAGVSFWEEYQAGNAIAAVKRADWAGIGYSSISPERAIATIVATQVGERNEDLSGIANRIAFEVVPDSSRRLDQGC